MKVLVINTSTPTVYLYLYIEGEAVSRSWEGTPTLGVDLLQAIDELLNQAGISGHDLDRIGVHKGPGHFSALRAGIVTATMLAEAWGVDLVSFTSNSPDEQILEVSEADVTNVVVPVYGGS